MGERGSALFSPAPHSRQDLRAIRRKTHCLGVPELLSAAGGPSRRSKRVLGHPGAKVRHSGGERNSRLLHAEPSLPIRFAEPPFLCVTECNSRSVLLCAFTTNARKP